MENITGKAVDGENYLQTRLYLVDDLRDILSTSSVIIDAPRRFGKTSVIKEFYRQEKTKNNYSILYFELEGTESIEAFCLALFKELISLYKFRNALDKLMNLGSDFWNQLVSRIGTLKLPEFEIKLKEYTQNFGFSEWKEKIETLLNGLDSFDKRTVIAFDEFPDMLQNIKTKSGPSEDEYRKSVDSLMAWLRTLREKLDESNYRFIFCGSINLRTTLNSIGLGKRLFGLESLSVPTMDENESRVLITSLLTPLDIKIDSESLPFLLSKIEQGPPLFGQMLIKALRGERKKQFTVNEVKSLYEGLIMEGNLDLAHFHKRLNDYLSPVERELSGIILKVLSNGAVEERILFTHHIEGRYEKEMFIIIVQRLMDEGYIIRNKEDRSKLQFISQMLRDWWTYNERRL